jgi:hypothetical protein
MRIALVLVAGALIFGMPKIGAAQGPAPSVLWQRPAPVPAATRVAATRYAAAFGVLGAAVCSQSDSIDNCTGIVVGTALLGAFVGGVTGGLIGGSIPKGEPADSTSEPS